MAPQKPNSERKMKGPGIIAAGGFLLALAGCGGHQEQVIPKHLFLSESHKFLLERGRTWPSEWQWERLENILDEEREELDEELNKYYDPVLKKTDRQGKEIRFRPKEMNHVNMLVTTRNGQRVFFHQLCHFDDAKECDDSEFLKGGMVTLETRYNNKKRWHILNILQLDSLQREPNSEIAVARLRNGAELRGKWVGNQETSDFYRKRREGARGAIGTPSSGYAEVPDAEVIGISGSRYLGIPIKDIQEILFDTSSARVQESPKKRKTIAKRVELKDGTVFTTKNGCVLDYYGYNSDSYFYCGTWRYWHTRVCRELEGNNVDVPQPADENVPEIFTEVEFTGRFVPEESQNREVIYTLKDGSKKTGVLVMHHKSLTTRTATPMGAPPVFGHRTQPSYPSGYSFSHSSRSDSHRTGRDFDKFYIARPFGATLVPLDDVRRVSVISEAELTEEPSPYVGE